LKNDDTVREGSKNIFEDLQLPNAEELNAKAQIAYRVCDILEERKLTQKEAATLLGIDQPKVSALLRGRLEGFSTDRLFRFLNALGRDIEIVIKPARKRRGSACLPRPELGFNTITASGDLSLKRQPKES
jgi:predicted XRE-type DNA-binding protein